MAEFPLTITGGVAPETTDPGVYAAWLHRQSTISLLRGMGVRVDAQLEHVLLNAGLGNTLFPYHWLEGDGQSQPINPIPTGQ